MGQDLDDRLIEAADYGLRWEANRQNLNLHTYDTVRLAANAVRHALGTGRIVPYDTLVERVDHEKERGDRWMRSFHAVERKTDELAVRVQRALSALEDRELAQALAKECGVMLLPVPATSSTRPKGD